MSDSSEKPNGTNRGEATDPERQPSASEEVWTYRGYHMRASEFNTALVHFYRAEINRANMWRQRLDATTNWAVITTGVAISVAFNEGVTNHAVIILNIFLITIFLFIEARRYRYYELWSYRVRLMETDFYAAMLVPPFAPAADWAESLAESLLQPKFPISLREAFGRRFRRNFIWLYVILALAWIMKVWLHPTSPASLAELIDRAAIGGISGWVVIIAGILLYVMLLAIGLFTIGLQGATGEVFPRYHFSLPYISPNATSLRDTASRMRAWFRASGHRQQLMVHIVTDQAQNVSRRILSEMHRGITLLPGKGMYTNKPHSVLMCVLTVTEVVHLKALVSAEDPHAFVVVSPAQEVFGSGFGSLSQAKAS
jgi:uncharacterized membrane protein